MSDPRYFVPTRPPNDSSNAAASTKYVDTAVAAGGGGGGGGGSGTGLGGTSRQALLRAIDVDRPNSVATLYNSLPSDPDDPIRIQWDSSIRVVAPTAGQESTTGILYQWIQSTLGLTAGQMATYIAAAVAYAAEDGTAGATGPAGPQGPAGPANNLSIGTVTTGASGSSASATITGTPPNQTLNLGIPTGPAGTNGTNGSPGPANTLAIGTVTTGAAGSSASATITGTSPNQTLNLSIPQGAPGAAGSGSGNVVASGTFTTGNIVIANNASGTAVIDGGYAPTYFLNASNLTSGTIPTAQTAAISGDITKAAGSASATLATVNTNVGSFGGASLVPSFTVNAKGLITAAGSTAVVAPAGTLSGTSLNATITGSSLTSVGVITGGTWNATPIAAAYIAAGAAASNIGTLGGDLTGTLPNPTLATVNSNTGSFGGASSVPTFTVNAKGLLTAAGSVAVVAPAGTLSGTTLNATVVNSSLTSVGAATGVTAATADNSTLLATTAFVKNQGYSTSGGGGAAVFTGASPKSANYTVTQADAGKVLQLTGSPVITLPAGLTANTFLWISKNDGTLTAASLTPASGTIDGLSSIKVYQEKFLIWTDGTNWFTQDRQKGWISLGGETVSGASSVNTNTYSIGFGDAEISEIDAKIINVSLTTTANPSTIQYIDTKGGTAGTSYTSTYVGAANGTAENNNNITTTFSLFGSGGVSSGPYAFTFRFKNSQSTNYIFVDYTSVLASTTNVTARSGVGYNTTSGAIQSFNVRASVAITGYITSIKGYRG